MRANIPDPEDVERITLHTSHHTHSVIGTGANDPQKMDPKASRETLDHSAMYIFAVALQDGSWHHARSYAPDRAARPDTVVLWRKICTAEDPEWTRRYHHPDPKEMVFGARAEIVLNNGEILSDELAVADAHPSGARPFGREDYIRKFNTLAEDVVSPSERERFLDTVQRLPELEASELAGLNVQVEAGKLDRGGRDERGIF